MLNSNKTIPDDFSKASPQIWALYINGPLRGDFVEQLRADQSLEPVASEQLMVSMPGVGSTWFSPSLYSPAFESCIKRQRENICVSFYSRCKTQGSKANMCRSSTVRWDSGTPFLSSNQIPFQSNIKECSEDPHWLQSHVCLSSLMYRYL